MCNLEKHNMTEKIAIQRNGNKCNMQNNSRKIDLLAFIPYKTTSLYDTG